MLIVVDLEAWTTKSLIPSSSLATLVSLLASPREKQHLEALSSLKHTSI